MGRFIPFEVQPCNGVIFSLCHPADGRSIINISRSGIYLFDEQSEEIFVVRSKELGLLEIYELERLHNLILVIQSF